MMQKWYQKIVVQKATAWGLFAILILLICISPHAIKDLMQLNSEQMNIALAYPKVDIPSRAVIGNIQNSPGDLQTTRGLNVDSRKRIRAEDIIILTKTSKSNSSSIAIDILSIEEQVSPRVDDFSHMAKIAKYSIKDLPRDINFQPSSEIRVRAYPENTPKNSFFIIDDRNSTVYKINKKPILNDIWDTVASDYTRFYSGDRLTRMGIAYGVGGIMANTDIDEDIQKWYQKDLHSSGTDNVAEITKMFGEGKYLIPLSLAAASMGAIISTENEIPAIGKWGQGATRAYLLGGPQLLVMQRVVGASRPGEDSYGSRWDPFNDTNAVSGHAFMGAVPFLTLAHMSENRLMRYVYYAASTLAGFSRINDDAHFTSQVFLGWFIAWEATGTVSEDTKENNFRIQPMALQEGGGVELSWHW